MGYGTCSPQTSVVGKIGKYIIFDIIIAGLPLLVDCLLCLVFDLKIENIFDYSIQICIMTIVLSATSIKGSIEGKIIRKNPKIFWLVLVSNISIIFISVLLYGIMEYDAIVAASNNISKEKPFILFVILYIVSFILGFLVQIGGGIDG